MWRLFLIVFQLSFTLINQTITENVVGFANLEWLVEVASPEQFSSLLAGSDLPIDSSLYYYSGDLNHSLTLHEVYRPAPYLNTRWGVGGQVRVRLSECVKGWEKYLISSLMMLMMLVMLMQEDTVCSVECEVWPGSLTTGSAGEEVRPDWSSPARNLRGRVSLHPHPASWDAGGPEPRSGVAGGPGLGPG